MAEKNKIWDHRYTDDSGIILPSVRGHKRTGSLGRMQEFKFTAKTDIAEIGRDLCRVKKDKNKDKKGGYIVNILTEELTERDKVVLICKNCEGIMKEACISSNGEHLCSGCDKGYMYHISKRIPNWAVRETINSLKCSCPLFSRGCLWLGKLEKCENHLDTCGYVYEECKLGCGELLKREEFGRHENENCVQRIIQCKHCSIDVIFRDNSKHLKECPLVTVTCYLCGVEKYRKDMTQHLEDDCPEKMIDCPFVKYKCLARMKRKDIDKHLEEKETKHLGLKLTTMEDLINKQSEIINKKNEEFTKQNKIITKQSEELKKLNENIEKQKKEMRRKISTTSQQIELLYSITDTTKIMWKIENVRFTPDFSMCKQHKVAGYRFALKCYNFERLSIVFPGTAIKPVRPFIAKCHIMLHSSHTINCGIIEVTQKDVLRGCEGSIMYIPKEDIEKYSEPRFPVLQRKI